MTLDVLKVKHISKSPTICQYIPLQLQGITTEFSTLCTFLYIGREKEFLNFKVADEWLAAMRP